jgi:hypothetical protein
MLLVYCHLPLMLSGSTLTKHAACIRRQEPPLPPPAQYAYARQTDTTTKTGTRAVRALKNPPKPETNK